MSFACRFCLQPNDPGHTCFGIDGEKLRTGHGVPDHNSRRSNMPDASPDTPLKCAWCDAKFYFLADREKHEIAMHPGQMFVPGKPVVLGTDEPSHIAAIRRDVEEIIALFKRKNANYAETADPWQNFKTAAPVAAGALTPAQYAATLVSKQDAALVKSLFAPSEGRQAELRERVMDGIVYRLIILQLISDAA